MEPLKTYDYLTIARQRLFKSIRPLSAEQYAQQFPIGLGTLGRTLTHIMICEWAYVQRLSGRDVPPYEQWPYQDENPPPFDVIEPKWNEQVKQTRAALAAVRNWHEAFEFNVTAPDNRRLAITASRADIFTQLTLHEVHHRAQAMNILRQLGIAAEDLDYNELMYKRRDVTEDQSAT